MKIFLMLILYSFLFLFLQARLIHHSREPDCYGVVFDAGSSGTRVTVYQWPCRTIKSVPKVDIKQIGAARTQKDNPGISSFNKNINGLDNYFNKLIKFAKSQIPASMVQYTPIMLGATAGMRVISQDDQDKIIKKIQYIFKFSGFLFNDPKWVRIITGYEEGAYLWLSVNYLKNSLFTNNIEETYDTIDLGGASTQIAERVEQSDNSFQLGNYNIKMYSQSYLGQGNDLARNSITQLLVSRTDQKEINHPCYNKHYIGKWDIDPTYTIFGTGEVERCKILIKRFLQIGEYECENSCGVYGKYQPEWRANTKIIGVNGVNTAAQTFDHTIFKVQQLLKEAEDLCAIPWYQFQFEAKFVNNPYASTMCFLNLYTAILLSDGYNIPSNKYIEAPNTIDGVSPSWTLASVFYQVSQVGCEQDSPVCQQFNNFFSLIDQKKL